MGLINSGGIHTEKNTAGYLSLKMPEIERNNIIFK
jgi:hypothetical protein